MVINPFIDMNVDTMVVLDGKKISVYLSETWPPDLPPLVEARPGFDRAAGLYKMLSKYGRPIEGAQALVFPPWLLHALAALAMTLYVRSPDSSLVNALLSETPASIVTLINEFAKRSKGRTGPVISPRYYVKLGKIVLDIAEAYFDGRS